MVIGWIAKFCEFELRQGHVLKPALDYDNE